MFFNKDVGLEIKQIDLRELIKRIKNLCSPRGSCEQVNKKPSLIHFTTVAQEGQTPERVSLEDEELTACVPCFPSHCYSATPTGWWPWAPRQKKEIWIKNRTMGGKY